MCGWKTSLSWKAPPEPKTISRKAAKAQSKSKEEWSLAFLDLALRLGGFARDCLCFPAPIKERQGTILVGNGCGRARRMTSPVGRVVQHIRQIFEGDAAALRDSQLLARFAGVRDEQAF